jgi:hypothetical protein
LPLLNIDNYLIITVCASTVHSFCPLILMPAGRRRRVEPGRLYTCAQDFYWDFRTLVEGNVRFVVDRQEQQRQLWDADNTPIPIHEANVRSFNVTIDEEIKTGRLDVSQRKKRYRELESEYVSHTRDWLRGMARDIPQQKEIRVPGEPDALRELLEAQTPERIHQLCDDAQNWPLHLGSLLPSYLSRYAEQFIKAKEDRRFPRSNRPSSELKQLWFLSRALAGASFGESTRTAINLVGSMRPEQIFAQSGAAKPKRKRRRQKHG